MRAIRGLPVLFSTLFALTTSAQTTLSTATPALVVPSTHFAFWNVDSVRRNNNCYNYATNRATNSFAQPGEASGREYQDYTCESLLAAAKADLGLVPTKYYPLASSDKESLIALVVAPGDDFHWYRRDSSGYWTHKPGQWPATNIDDSGRQITSPETADRGDYTDFCGYFKVKDYQYEADQQNGGFVRIGKMRSLPALPGRPAVVPELLSDTVPVEDQSEVELLLYSGRPNPRVPLSEALKDESLSKMLRVSSIQVSGIVQASIMGTTAPHLGPSGVVIHDREGLLLPQGTEVYFPTSQAPILDPTHPANVGNALQNFMINRQVQK